MTVSQCVKRRRRATTVEGEWPGRTGPEVRRRPGERTPAPLTGPPPCPEGGRRQGIPDVGVIVPADRPACMRRRKHSWSVSGGHHEVALVVDLATPEPGLREHHELGR